MPRITTFKFALDLSSSQKRECLRYAGAARKAFNWGLALVKSQLDERRLEIEAGQLPLTQVSLSRNQLIPAFNAFKLGPEGEEDGIAYWYEEVSKYCFEEALRPGPDGVSRSRICHATISRKGSRWYVSITIEAPDLHPERKRAPNPNSLFAGVDLGINCYAVVADENGQELERISPLKPLRSQLRKLQRASRCHSRKRKGSSLERRKDHREGGSLLKSSEGSTARYATKEATSCTTCHLI